LFRGGEIGTDFKTENEKIGIYFYQYASLKENFISIYSKGYAEQFGEETLGRGVL